MILIADGGSTKCDWVLLDASGEVILKAITLGLNPAVLRTEELLSVIKSNNELSKISNKVTAIDFYGAGCGTEIPRNNLRTVLKDYFVKAKVTVQEDMMAAVYSVTQEPAIVCILGTGSNSCYFDGKNIHLAVDSLGYVMMDEASGNYFGRQLIRDYFYKKMPSEIAIQFEEQYNLSPDVIKLNLYKKPNPNAYLASFAKFIFDTQDEEAYFYNLLNVGISKFIKNHILCYENAKELPIHFVGSIAYFSKKIIKENLKNHHLEFGLVIQKPMEGLIEYYKKHKLK